MYVDIGALEVTNGLQRPPAGKCLWRWQNIGKGGSWPLKDEEDFIKERNLLGYLDAQYILGDRSAVEKGSVKLML